MFGRKKELEELREKLEELEKKKNDLQEELDQVYKTVGDLQKEKVQLQNRLNDFEKEDLMLKEKVSIYEEKIEKMLSSYEEKVEKLIEGVKIRDELLNLKELNKKLEEEVSSLKSRIEEAEITNQELQTEKLRMENELTEVKDRTSVYIMKEVDKIENEYRTKLEQLEKRYDRLLEELKNELGKKDAEIYKSFKEGEISAKEKFKTFIALSDTQKRMIRALFEYESLDMNKISEKALLSKSDLKYDLDALISKDFIEKDNSEAEMYKIKKDYISIINEFVREGVL